MVNSKEILARLQNGEKAEDIASELVNALNEANNTYLKEQEAKRVENEAKAKREANKVKDMQEIVDLLHDFCIEYYCDNNEDMDAVEEAFAELTAENLIAIIEETGAIALDMEKKMKDIEKLFGAAPVKTLKVDKNTDSIINNFLKSIGL